MREFDIETYCNFIRIAYKYECNESISELEQISNMDEVYCMSMPYQLMSLDKEKVNNAIKNCKTHEGYW